MSHCTRLPLLFPLVALFAPVFSPAQVAWVKRYDEALRQARSEKKLVVLDLSASWCRYCRKMAQEVYPDRRFIEFSRTQVFMRLFADRDPEGARLARRFNVRGYPTILVLSAQGEEVGRLVGARTVGRLIADLEAIFDTAVVDDESETETPGQVQPTQTQPPAPNPPAAVKQTVPASSDKEAGREPARTATAEPPPVKPTETDPIARLEARLAAAAEGPEKDWLHLMIGIAHFQARHWKEARVYLNKVLEKDPENAAAREMIKSIDRMQSP